MTDNPYRELPSVTELAGYLAEFAHDLNPAALLHFAKSHLALERENLRSGVGSTREEILGRASNALTSIMTPRLQPVINATGIVIHTNLGRAPVSNATAAAMAAVAAGSVALELDPATGERGGRMDEVSSLMRLLTGAEATLVVNNNAAAILLTLSALANGREVIVSRGEAVEIGGGFRIPDVMRQSGAKLVEIGTTNRTYAADYERAIASDTAVLLKVHASNFAIAGFVATAAVGELATIAARHGIPIIEDLGSGALLASESFGLAHEPTIGEQIAAGASVITASGDKLLGGPQAGIIAGRADLVAKIGRHPLARAVRADKTALAGIAATLQHYVAGNTTSEIPIWRMISAPVDQLRARADGIQGVLKSTGIDCEILEVKSAVGGGSLPGQSLPSVAVALSSISVDGLATRLRLGQPGVYGRIENNRVLMDLRTVLPESDQQLTTAIRAAISA